MGNKKKQVRRLDTMLELAWERREIQIQAKYACRNLRRLLRCEVPMIEVTARHFQDDFIYVLPDVGGRTDRRLRLRYLYDATRSRFIGCTLTHKGTPTLKRDRRLKGKKVRERYESRVDEPIRVAKLLDLLPHRRRLRFQKYRTVFKVGLREQGFLLVSFDETPLGNFLEMEGTAGAIDQLAALLGYSSDDAIGEGYYALWRQSRATKTQLREEQKEYRIVF